MPIKAYIGDPRQGKTYEVVTGTVYGSLCKGRRVVSNIAGLNRDAMLSAFIDSGGSPDNFGELVQVSNDQVLEPLFWRTDRDVKEGVDSFIKPGDVLALDEIWRFWAGFGLKDDEGKKRPERVMNFFRMHGHFTHPESGLCCEIAFITQDVGDFHRSTRAIINETFKMTKLTVIGSSTHYRVDIYQKTAVTRKPLRSLQRKYNSDYFSFYKSHSQRQDGDAEPVEESPDQRGNLLKGALFRVIIPVGVLVFGFAAWFIYGFFHPKIKDLPASSVSSKSTSTASVSTKPLSSETSSGWRILGYYQTPSGLTIYMHNGDHSRVLHSPPGYKISALSIETVLPSGEVVADWTGGKNGGGILPGTK